MTFKRGDGLETHDVFLWPLKLVFYAWLTLALMALAAMGMEILLAKQVWGDATALAQVQQTLHQDIELTHSLRPEAPLTGLAEACARGVYGFFFQLIPFERWMTQRRVFETLDDHVFISSNANPLNPSDVSHVFRNLAQCIGIPRGPGLPRAMTHSLRHTFAVASLQACPDGRDQIARHMLALSTYLGHVSVATTYWYLQATPQLMQGIATQCETFVGAAK